MDGVKNFLSEATKPLSEGDISIMFINYIHGTLINHNAFLYRMELELRQKQPLTKSLHNVRIKQEYQIGTKTYFVALVSSGKKFRPKIAPMSLRSSSSAPSKRSS